MKIDKIELQQVHYMPKELKPGVLYVSKEFSTSAHLCACGCGSKIRIPLGPTDWAFEETNTGPSLYPSIGNWQIACKSHYWINRGEIIWANRWTDDQIAAGRQAEEKRRLSYFDKFDSPRNKIPLNFWRWFKDLFNR